MCPAKPPKRQVNPAVLKQSTKTSATPISPSTVCAKLQIRISTMDYTSLSPSYTVDRLPVEKQSEQSHSKFLPISQSTTNHLLLYLDLTTLAAP